MSPQGAQELHSITAKGFCDAWLKPAKENNINQHFYLSLRGIKLCVFLVLFTLPLWILHALGRAAPWVRPWLGSQSQDVSPASP